METRDGTPFMGLTTQDGIPSSVENLKPNKQTTTNKTRCTSCPQSEECTCKAAFFVQRCKDCLHFAASPERHREHRREARHIHSYRNRAYRFVNLCYELFHLYFCIHIYVITIYYSMRHCTMGFHITFQEIEHIFFQINIVTSIFIENC